MAYFQNLPGICHVRYFVFLVESHVFLKSVKIHFQSWVGEESSPAASSNSFWVWRICFKIYPCYTSYWYTVEQRNLWIVLHVYSFSWNRCVPYRQIPGSRTCFPDLLQHRSIVLSFCPHCFAHLPHTNTPGNSLFIDMLLMLIPNFEFWAARPWHVNSSTPWWTSCIVWCVTCRFSSQERYNLMCTPILLIEKKRTDMELWLQCMYIYIYPAGGSPGTPAPRGFIYMKLGWGGVGMVTFLELANMVDATQEVGSWVYYYFTFFLRYYLYDFISTLRMLSSRW